MRSVVNAVWVCLLMLAAVPQARDWGFSKDTVYEYDSRYGQDSYQSIAIQLMNQADKPLNIDSAWLEIAEPDQPEAYFVGAIVSLSGSNDALPHMFWGKRPNDDGDSLVFVWPKNYTVDPNETERIEVVRLQGGLRNENVKPVSDRLVVRAIFRAKSRDLDTLVVVGDYQYCYQACPTSDANSKRLSVTQNKPNQKPPSFLVNGRKPKTIKSFIR